VEHQLMLRDVHFSDLILGPEGAWIRSQEGPPRLSGDGGGGDPAGVSSSGLLPIPSSMEDDVSAIREMIASQKPGKFYLIRYDGLSLRGSRRESIDGEWHFLRRALEGDMPTLQDLGIHPDYGKVLLNPKLVRGGVLIIGEPGSGKTTTASAMVSQRLTLLGGFALTLENPPELPLHGQHGNGICVQVPVDGDDFADSCAQALRDAAANMVLIGEILDPQTAVQFIRLCMIGKLVISTVHGPNLVLGLERMADMISGVSGDKCGALSMLADGLSVVIHQSLETKSDGGKRLRTSILQFTPQVKEYVRRNQLPMLVNEIKNQAAQMIIRQGSRP
jgi:Tfp pilus assembly pilus retraction ATPase PilT